MALSEHEQRLLDEMERGLYDAEADVMRGSGTASVRLNYRMLVIGVLIAVVGIGLLVVAAAAALVWLGVAAFIVMTVGVTRAFVPEKASEKTGSVGSGSKGQKRGGSFTQRFEERWENRMNRE